MGFFGWLLGKNNVLPVVTSILPDAPKQEIMHGRLPILNTNSLFLQSGEYCHYIEKAILLKDKTKKSYVRRNAGYSMPGLFKGARIRMIGGRTDVEEQIITEQYRGIFYLTNKRAIFVAQSNGFQKNLSTLTAITPYSNAIELQFEKDTVRLLLPDGNVANAAFQLIKQGGIL